MLIMVWGVERVSWSWALVKLEALCRYTTFLWLIISFTSCSRCSRKEKILLYIFHVQLSYTTFLFGFFFSSSLLSPTSPFSKLPTTSTACIRLKWEDFKVQKLWQSFFVVCIQANFFYFCGVLGATYSSIWRWWSEWKICAFCIWPSNYFLFCRKQNKHKSPVYSQNIWLSDLFCRSSLLYPFCNGLITSGFTPLHNTSQKKALCLFVFSSIVHLCSFLVK